MTLFGVFGSNCVTWDCGCWMENSTEVNMGRRGQTGPWIWEGGKVCDGFRTLAAGCGHLRTAPHISAALSKQLHFLRLTRFLHIREHTFPYPTSGFPGED